MLEGQDGITWEIWKHYARAVEDLGFAGLFRSDHFTNAGPPDRDSLEMWLSMAWLADNTKRIEFGPLVSPFSFRHPVFNARMGKDVDDLSGGRFILGIGAGWQEREHIMFGFPLLELKERMDRFEEGAEITWRLLRSEERVNFAGTYYSLQDAILLPRPQRPGGPRILIGGIGKNRTLGLVARYADEWNGVYVTPAKFVELNSHLDGLLAAEGRPANAVRRSLMQGLVFGSSDSEITEKLRGRSPAELEKMGVIVGTAGAVQEALARYAEAGVERIMLQWLDLENRDGFQALAQALL